ncbi:hypothetical protein G7054_g3703 [Neopestalotiopsis clavispora]|nr:hypothetical protein G7054_g3703 [Neopestalotiopsis clavispora]
MSWTGLANTGLNSAIGTVLLVFCILTLALCATEAILYKASRLRPALLLAFACIKTTIWLVFFFFVVVSAAHGAPSPLNLIIAIMLAVTSVGQLVLGAIYTHKLQKSIHDRGRYADLESEGSGKAAPNMATLPRSNTWRKSIPAVTVTSRQWSPRSSIEEEEDITDYESYRNSLLQAENLRTGGAHELAVPESSPLTSTAVKAETRTIASSDYEASILSGVVSPPTSPGLATTLSPPPIQKSYSPASNTYEFDQADLAITGFYGSGYEGDTRRF